MESILVNSVFPIVCRGIKASKLLVAGKWDWVRSDIDEQEKVDKLFPIEPHPPISRVMRLVELLRSMTTDEIFVEFDCHGLRRPDSEEALTFGVAYPEEQWKYIVEFLHEPVQMDMGDHYKPVVLATDYNDRIQMRYLNLFPFRGQKSSKHNEEGRYFVYAAVQKS